MSGAVEWRQTYGPVGICYGATLGDLRLTVQPHDETQTGYDALVWRGGEIVARRDDCRSERAAKADAVSLASRVRERGAK